MRDPRLLGADAVKQATTEQLTFYEKRLVSQFLDDAAMRKFLGEENLNAPGMKKYDHKRFTSGPKPATSINGDEDSDGTIGMTDIENIFVVTNQKYHIKYYDLERSILSGVNIDTQSAMSIGKRIAEEMDYKIWNGDATHSLTGIKAGAQDAGAPSGVWDIAGKAYDDILDILGKLRDFGWNGAIDVLHTPGLTKIWDRWVSDGTTTLGVTYREWLMGSNGRQGLLNGGQIIASSHAFTQLSGPATGDKNTGASGAADNQFVAHARGQGAHVKLAHELKSLPIPVQTGDIHKNVKIKYTVANYFPNMLSYMDAIDTVT